MSIWIKVDNTQKKTESGGAQLGYFILFFSMYRMSLLPVCVDNDISLHYHWTSIY